MDGPIVAIPERSGARITGDLLTVVGFEALWVLTGEAQLRLAVGEEYHLAGSLRCERKKTQEDVRCCSQPGD
jgi:hypothetical protein